MKVDKKKFEALFRKLLEQPPSKRESLKTGEKKKNPFTGEEYTTKPKPASVKVKAFPVKMLNESIK